MNVTDQLTLLLLTTERRWAERHDRQVLRLARMNHMIETARRR